MTPKRQNPPWTRDELILALDVYFRVNPQHTNEHHPEIAKLSKLLQSLPLHSPITRGPEFRNSAGVYMKLGNFLSLDETYDGVGLRAGSRLDKEVWDRYSGDRAELKALADAIQSGARHVQGPEGSGSATDDDDEEFSEGRILARLHKRRERSRLAVQNKKAQALKRHGKLACEVCGFDFHERYGALGRGFAECHHTIPVSKLTDKATVRLAELAIVCANCHRMLHRSNPMMTISALGSLLQGSSPSHESL